jgi:hypothetical protein
MRSLSIAIFAMTVVAFSAESSSAVAQGEIYAPNNQGIVTQGQMGNNTINNYVAHPQRRLNKSMGDALLQDIPRNKPVQVFYLMNDSESKAYAIEIDSFFRKNGQQMANNEPPYASMFADTTPFVPNVNLHAQNDKQVWVIIGAYQ